MSPICWSHRLNFRMQDDIADIITDPNFILVGSGVSAFSHPYFPILHSWSPFRHCRHDRATYKQVLKVIWEERVAKVHDRPLPGKPSLRYSPSTWIANYSDRTALACWWWNLGHDKNVGAVFSYGQLASLAAAVAVAMLHVLCYVLYVNFSSTPTSILNLTIYSERELDTEFNDIFCVEKYCQLFTHESKAFLSVMSPIETSPQSNSRTSRRSSADKTNSKLPVSHSSRSRMLTPPLCESNMAAAGGPIWEGACVFRVTFL